jgi:hypothetical protein
LDNKVKMMTGIAMIGENAETQDARAVYGSGDGSA